MARLNTLAEYYADPLVQLRIREYCGGRASHAPTCEYLAAMHGNVGGCASWEDASRYPADALPALLSSGADLARSMWDRSSLIFHLELDYQNVDLEGEPYHHPVEAFSKLETTYRAVTHVFRRFRLPLFALMTGRGYHFTGRVPLDSDVTDRLVALAPARPSWLGTFASRRPGWLTSAMSERQAKGYVGIGMVVEFLAQKVQARARPRSPIPVVLNGTVVGNGAVGRESVSIDISYVGDPLDTRTLRVAFGAYQKHRFRPDIVGQAASDRPSLIAVPRNGESLTALLSRGRDFRHAARAARSASAVLPDVSGGVDLLLEAYHASSLARFHQTFYATPPPADGWLTSALPACVLRPLSSPNDLLLQPAVIQHVTRSLMAEGMPPRHVAAVVQARYGADHNWGTRWSWMDGQARADFDVRVFAGMLATGADRAIDFNCRSAQEKGLCPGGWCGRDLRDERARLLEVVRA